MKALVTSLFLALNISTFALAEGVYTVIIKKQEEKKKNRWTLADWLATKKTIALQDQWLALNSSETWFEFVLDYGLGTLEETKSSDSLTREMDMSRFGGALYIKFIGLEYNSYSFDTLYDQSDYRLNLLILGSSIQSTHLRGFYGQRSYSYQDYSNYDQNFWGGNLTFYLANFLGIEGTFTKYLEASSDNSTYTSDGERTELTAFLELWALRLYATQFKERMLFRGASESEKTNLEGTVFGVKLFF